MRRKGTHLHARGNRFIRTEIGNLYALAGPTLISPSVIAALKGTLGSDPTHRERYPAMGTSILAGLDHTLEVAEQHQLLRARSHRHRLVLQLIRPTDTPPTHLLFSALSRRPSHSKRLNCHRHRHHHATRRHYATKRENCVNAYRADGANFMVGWPRRAAHSYLQWLGCAHRSHRPPSTPVR